MINSLKDLYYLLSEGKKDGDILQYLGYNVKNSSIEVDYYAQKIKRLPEGNYIISDLDGTFYRGFTIELTIDYFVRYVKSLHIFYVDNVKLFKDFIEDYYYFGKLKQKAYNREIDFMLYLDVGIYFLYKYIDKFNYLNFINFLKDDLSLKLIVNPYKFSINFMVENLNRNRYFLFVSGSSNFIFDIYLNLLKKYIYNLYGKNLSERIFGFGSYSDFENKIIYNLWSYEQKKNFIEKLKNIKKINVISGMGDTISDFGIADNIMAGGEFYFINPDYKVIEEFYRYKRNDIDYHFINERKGFYFEYFLENIKFLD